MKHAFLALAGLIAGIGTAGAQGINLSWDDCGTAGQSFKSFACNTNEGQDVLVASFVATPGPDSINGFNAVVSMTSITSVLPDWWEHTSPFDFVPSPDPECRDTLGMSLAFDPTSVSCDAAFPFRALNYTVSPFDPAPNKLTVRLSIIGTSVIPSESERYAFSLIIHHDMTTGLGACAGCDVPLCIVLNEIEVGGRFAHEVLTTPIDRNFVTWQTAEVMGCPLSTPVRRSTWGQIRSLYR